LPKILDRLDRQGEGPLFMYIHLFDPHSPYDLAGTSGTPFEGYVREIGLIDQAVRLLRQKLHVKGLANRTAIFVTSDHGEAFGEHNTRFHAVSVYDELLRVPLIMHVPGTQPRRIALPVSVIDIGPTILDLMGQPTPGVFMGQSLTPYLRGSQALLSRPLVADTGRMMQAMIFEDGLKVIRNRRTKMVEIYDLAKDPGERVNLADTMTDMHRERLDTLRVFFRAHTLERTGYTVPYRP
jgi:arylsulfatase A-like enzyme